jgi:hypothetical protein
MPPQTWATPDQLQFLTEEDKKWEMVKSGGATLKSFYFVTTQAFHERWPATPDDDILEEAGHDAGKAQEIAQEQLLSVSALAYTTSAPSHLTP